MARIRYRNINFRPDRLARIVQMNKILEEYTSKVSVRQLYYRLVGAALIPNNKTEYNKIQDLITAARYAGLIDWNAIEDRGREAAKKRDWHSAKDALDGVIEEFRLDRWADQPYYVELWVEKDALEGVLTPIAIDYHIPLMSTRGYNSASALKETAERINRRVRGGRKAVVLYVGDFDPSGLHMVSDARARLAEFGCPASLDIRRVAITWEQIQAHKPPPNPLKRKDDPDQYEVADGSFADSRALDYVALHGEESWEADALPPKTLDLEVRTMLNAYVNKKLMTAAIARENFIKNAIKKFAAGFKEP